jgi:RHS repeat-associated protein
LGEVGARRRQRCNAHAHIAPREPPRTTGGGIPFDAWGKPESTPAWDDAAHPRVRHVRTGFTGHEHDPEHGLINMRGRIYDPELGRFTTADPIVQAPFFSQSYNRYAYVLNNPLRFVDPSGFLPCTPGFCQMANFFNTGDAYFESGSLRSSEHDWWKGEFRSGRELANDTRWLSMTEKQNRDAATITHGYLLRWDSELTPEQRAWKDKWYQVRAAWISGGKVAAIAKAIEVYNLKGLRRTDRGQRGPMIAAYDKDLDKDLNAITEFATGKVRVGPAAFDRSVSFLISGLMHEAFHVEGIPDNKAGVQMDKDFEEAAAWQLEFNMRLMTGLSASEVATVLERRQSYLDELNSQYLQRFYQGNRTPR